MNKTLLTSLLAIVILGGGIFFWSQADASVGNLNIYEGKVDIVRGDKITVGQTGTEIRKKDVIKVGDNSRVSIILKDGSVIRLEADSEVQVLKITYKDNQIDSASFRLISGKIWSKVEPLEVNAGWQVETPKVVSSVRGTQFNTRYIDKTNEIFAYKGQVGVALLENLGEEKLVGESQEFILADETLNADFAKNPKKIKQDQYDEWITFNLVEDARLEGKEFMIEKTSTTTPTLNTPRLPADNKKKEVISTPVTSIVSTTTPRQEEAPKPVVNKLEVTYTKTSSSSRYPNIQFKATYSSDNSSKDVTSLSSWIVSGSAGGSINLEGVYTPEANGEAEVEVTYKDITVRINVSIP